MATEKYQECIDACNDCAIECNNCAIECLNENEVQNLARCIQLDMECAAICRSAVEVMSLDSEYSERICEICADICNDCAEECKKHASNGMEHCADCAEFCRRCAEACLTMIGANVH